MPRAAARGTIFHAFSTATAGAGSGANGQRSMRAVSRIQCRRGQIRTASRDGRPDQAALKWPGRQGGQHRQRRRMILGGHHAVMYRSAIGNGNQQVALAADPFHFAVLGTVRRSARHAVHRELQAR
jgi:hypothetical protein